MFGQYRHALDPKGRLFVPAKLREELGSAFYVAKAPDACLTVYPEAEWQKVLDHCNALPASKARGMRVFFANVVKCEPDKQGASSCRSPSAPMPGSRRRRSSSDRPDARRSGRQSAMRRRSRSISRPEALCGRDGGAGLLMEFQHRSVLLDECIDALSIRPDGIYLDGTLGGAGHSLEICRRLTTGRLIGVDCDEVALRAAAERLKPFADRVTTVHSNFARSTRF